MLLLPHMQVENGNTDAEGRWVEAPPFAVLIGAWFCIQLLHSTRHQLHRNSTAANLADSRCKPMHQQNAYYLNGTPCNNRAEVCDLHTAATRAAAVLCRLILSDALYEAACSSPDILIDAATLTGKPPLANSAAVHH
jgi:hypothetical protein